MTGHGAWPLVWAVLLLACGPSQQARRVPSSTLPLVPSPLYPSPVVLASPLYGERVSLVRVLADPKAWHGRAVRVGGYMHLEFEGNQLCLHREDVEFLVLTNCVWLSVPNTPEVMAINDRYVAVEGVVDANSRGHMGMFQAAIDRVTSLGALPSRAALEAWHSGQNP